MAVHHCSPADSTAHRELWDMQGIVGYVVGYARNCGICCEIRRELWDMLSSCKWSFAGKVNCLEFGIFLA